MYGINVDVAKCGLYVTVCLKQARGLVAKLSNADERRLMNIFVR